MSRFSQLPAVFRFFAGGDNSVRGFGYNDLSPTEAVCTYDPSLMKYLRNDPQHTCQSVAGFIKVGGKDELTGTVEVIRDLPNNLAIATFFDYGNAFDHLGRQCAPHSPPGAAFCSPLLQYSVGIGLRVRLPVLTLGVDIAQPLSDTCVPPTQPTPTQTSPGSCRRPGPRLHINFSPKL